MSAIGPEEEIHHLLVWMPNWIGDAVFCLPAVQALRERFPQARLTGLARPPAHEFLSCHPAFDSVIPLPGGGAGDGLLSQLRFAAGLRKYRFDLAVLFPNSFRCAFLAGVTGARRRLGYETEGRGILLTDPVRREADSRSVHGADYFAGLLRPLGIDRVEREIQPLQISAVELESGQEFLARWGLKEDAFLVAVSPGASKPEKQWHTERFGILCQQLVKQYQARILLLGSGAERPLLEQVGAFCPPEATRVLAGENLQMVCALMQRCRLLVANDSGLMNLGAMLGTAVVAVFGPGHPRTTDPLIGADRKEIVTLDYPCSPCRHRFFKDCDPSPHRKPYCLEDISVRQVAEAVERLLQRLGIPSGQVRGYSDDSQ